MLQLYGQIRYIDVFQSIDEVAVAEPTSDTVATTRRANSLPLGRALRSSGVAAVGRGDDGPDKHARCGLHAIVSAGNRALADLADFLDDPDAAAIGVIIESTAHPEKLLPAARRGRKTDRRIESWRAASGPEWHPRIPGRAPATDAGLATCHVVSPSDTRF